MSGDSQRGPGSGGTANRGRPGAGQARQNAGGQSPPGDGQDHVGEPTIEQGLDKALTKANKVVKRTVEATTDEITTELQEALKS